MAKKLNEKQLSKASGGVIPEKSSGGLYCFNCQKSFATQGQPSRTIDKNCTEVLQYQCPDCHEWVDYQ